MKNGLNGIILQGCSTNLIFPKMKFSVKEFIFAKTGNFATA